MYNVLIGSRDATRERCEVRHMEESKRRATFTVPGDVLGKPRPRVNRNGRVWTPKKFKKYEDLIADMYRETGCGRFSGPVSVKVDTYRSLPKSRPQKVAQEPDRYKPDADNILKIVLDALNGVAYEDDNQVVVCSVCKHPRTRGVEHMVVEVAEVVD